MDSRRTGRHGPFTCASCRFTPQDCASCWGVLCGVALAFVSLFQVVPAASGIGRGAGFRIVERDTTAYQAEAVVVIDTPAFGIGRMDIAVDRANDLASVYGYLAASDEVMNLVGQRVGAPLDVEVTAERVERAPVVKILVDGTDFDRVTEVADATVEAFIAYLRRMQVANGVPEDQRMVVRYVNAPKVTEQSTRTAEMAVLAFLLPVLGSLGIALAIDNIRSGRPSTNETESESEPLASTSPRDDVGTESA